MSWDESLFRFALKSTRWIMRAGRDEKDPNSIALESIERRLRLLACLLTGESISIRAAEDLGGYSGSTLLLPKVIALSPRREGNVDAYLFRVVYALASRALGFTLPDRVCSFDEQVLITLVARPAVDAWLERHLPLSQALVTGHEFHSSLELIKSACGPDELPTAIERAIAQTLQKARAATSCEEAWRLASELMPKLSKRFSARLIRERLAHLGLLLPRATPSEAESKNQDEAYSLEALASGSEKKAANLAEQIERVDLGKNNLDENPLVHSFEKVHTAEEYSGGKKTLDGSDELADHAEALDELNLRHVIRSQERTASVLKGDFALESGAPDLIVEDEEEAGSAIAYDEWDEKKREYRREWCRVHARVAPIFSSDLESCDVPALIQRNKRQIDELRSVLIAMVNQRRWRRRLADGAEIDLEAVVDWRADLKSGHSGLPKLYASRRRSDRDIATLILLDLSLSTDSWIENRRVLDISRESVVVLAKVLEGIHDKAAIGGFFSNTRRDCRYHSFKDFKEPWSKALPRLASARPTGYTRIGPALRHATSLLKQVPAKKRLLLMISDGKPTDYDRYEGSYGIADVRQAIREASQADVQIRALAIDTEAKFYLPRMFGLRNYQILRHPSQLAPFLAKIYTEVLK
jgi:nitric oxide reductase NorD protein